MLRCFLVFSLRLTAYVAKVFAMASNLVSIQSSVICDAIGFLITNTQNSDGSFREIGKVYMSSMNVRNDSTNIKSVQNAPYLDDAVFCVVSKRIVFWHVQGDVNGRDADASMTAFCLIALQESRFICRDKVSVSVLQ